MLKVLLYLIKKGFTELVALFQWHFFHFNLSLFDGFYADFKLGLRTLKIVNFFFVLDSGLMWVKRAK